MAIFTGVLTFSTILLWLETRRLAKGSEDRHAAVDRAFVYLTGTSVAQFDRANPRSDRFLQFEWKNSGQTPTRDATIATDFACLPGELPDDFAYAYGAGRVQGAFLGAGAEIHSSPLVIPFEDFRRAAAKERFLYVWGRIDYRDILSPDAPRHTKFCIRFSAIPINDAETMMGFPIYGPYNGSEQG